MPEPYANCNRPERPLMLRTEHGGRTVRASRCLAIRHRPVSRAALANRRRWIGTLAKFKVRVVSVPALGHRLFVLEEGFVDENRLAALELLQQVLGLLIQDKLL